MPGYGYGVKLDARQPVSKKEALKLGVRHSVSNIGV